jgi:hypothetical protein
MKKLFFVLFFSAWAFGAMAQAKKPAVQPDSTKALQVVDASCGQCKFGLKGKGCSLAVRINDKAYFVDGSDIDSHGDAHADDGFCNKIRKAKVQGEVVDNRFKATYFQLMPEDTKKKS